MIDNDFTLENVDGVIIEKINFTRATLKEAEVFRNRLKRLIDNDHKKIIIDLSNCEYFDSTFMGAIVLSYKKTRENKGMLYLIVPDGYMTHIINVTGLNKVLKVFKTREEALESISII